MFDDFRRPFGEGDLLLAFNRARALHEFGSILVLDSRKGDSNFLIDAPGDNPFWRSD
jgi:hypothetical protein